MIATFTAFDVMSFVSPLKRFAPMLLAIVAVAVFAPFPAFSIAAAAALMILLAPQTFATDERGRLDTLYATLPVSRRTVVVGRYLALVLLYLVMAAFATAVAAAVGLVQGERVSPGLLALVNLGALVFFLLVIAVQLPFFFAAGFTRARPMMYIPLVVVAGLAWLAGRLGIHQSLAPGDLGALHPALAVTLVLLALAAVVTVSAMTAAARYARRSL